MLKKTNQKAFTLIELIIVIIIIWILMTVVGVKVKWFIDSAKLSSAMASTDAISKSVNQFNTAALGTDSWLVAGTNEDPAQKFAGQLVFRSASDDSIVSWDYFDGHEKQGSTALKDVLKNTYKISPSNYLVDTDLSGYGNKKYSILVKTDSWKITAQVLLYCLKTTSFKWTANYEAMWSRESKKTDDASWVNGLKTAAEDKNYNCIVKTIPYAN